MKFDGNYRTETWEKDADGRMAYTSFIVDDEQVTLTYDLMVEILDELGFSKADA